MLGLDGYLQKLDRVRCMRWRMLARAGAWTLTYEVETGSCALYAPVNSEFAGWARAATHDRATILQRSCLRDRERRVFGPDDLYVDTGSGCLRIEGTLTCANCDG